MTRFSPDCHVLSEASHGDFNEQAREGLMINVQYQDGTIERRRPSTSQSIDRMP
jgi:hypothetical protein